MLYKKTALNFDSDWLIDSSIDNYLIYGLDPGSFCVGILLLDFDRAFRAKHELIEKKHIEYYISKLKTYPDIFYGSKDKINSWMANGGYQYATKSEKVILKLTIPNIDDYMKF